ncbi:hypothetical protein C5167_008113 [Papaver somniferum]|uniref:Alcohol dehydrogenase-like C-terminal domain-containing protein n=1 Tax=Papaver somniferum TaxID=3469 RepID=A0A4Y7JTL0_PAPSO|nr:hypothetical protein C5167_008113 [Papaver somniferum]
MTSSYSMVESVGDNVVEVKEGDIVIPFFHPNCEECWDCKSKESNICSKFPFGGFGMPRDGTSRFTDSNGEIVNYFIKVSSFIEYTVVDICNLMKINPDFPLDKACLLSCGIPTGTYVFQNPIFELPFFCEQRAKTMVWDAGIGAAWNTAKVKKGSTVAIFGLGAIGLAVAEGARISGAAKIIGVDLNPEKFKIGSKFGVTDFINPKDCGNRPVNEVIKEMTDGGADYCFECVGLASLMNLAFTSCRNGSGKTIVLGVEMNGTPLSLGCYELLKGKTITGSIFGGIKAKKDIPLLAQSYINKELHLDDFITHEVNFEDVNKAFDLLIQGKSLRCIIWMGR